MFPAQLCDIGKADQELVAIESDETGIEEGEPGDSIGI
jgi:hypothetical protein